MWVDSNFGERSYDSKSSSGLVLQMNNCTIDAACLLDLLKILLRLNGMVLVLPANG